jgi:membrane fusion protein, adhesin transport system
MRKQLTGEPVAGKPHSGFGGRGWRAPFPTPIDASDDGLGNFRIMVVPDETDVPWPSERWLRQGVRTKGWILLNRVTLAFEIWRQLNGFPPLIPQDSQKLDIARKTLK